MVSQVKVPGGARATALYVPRGSLLFLGTQLSPCPQPYKNLVALAQHFATQGGKVAAVGSAFPPSHCSASHLSC